MKSIKVICEKLFIGSVFLSLVSFSSVYAAEGSTNLRVNVKETLNVSISTPTTWASGDIDDFLRNDLTISVETNNTAGFTASMYAEDTINLKNTTNNTVILPSLSSSYQRKNFPANYWGYSLGEYKLNGTTQNSYTLNGKSYNETLPGNGDSYYYPLVSNPSSPIIIMDGATTPKTSGSQEIYFGAKANATKASGTYTGTVVISVVTGVISNPDNPVTPENPVTPSDNEVATYHPGTGATTYSYTTTNSGTGTTTTTTEVSDLNNPDAYSGYTHPQGVRYNTGEDGDGNLLANTLSIVSSVALTSGFFLLAAKRKEYDEEKDK